MDITKYFQSNHYLCLSVIAIVCFFSFFVNNQIIPADLMEARNLVTAQEMVKYGNYLLPTMNGEPRLEKPPLPTWIAAVIEHLTPSNLVVQRYAAGLSATLMTFFLFLLMTQLTQNRVAGTLAALIMATSLNVMLMGRTATWDIYTHSFMLSAIYFMVIALKEEGAQWKYFLLSGLFIGLSFLSKGPVSLYAMLLPFLISHILVYRTSIVEKKWAITGMIIVALVISFWWFGYTYFSHDDFAVGIAEKEISSWKDRNVRPWYYYWQFAAEGGIWALFWITSIIYFFINKQTIYRKEYKFSFIWFLASLIALSIIPEKKARYLLPILIPGAMLIGFYMLQMMSTIKTKYEKIFFCTNAIVISIILSALPISLYILFYREDQISVFLFIIAILCSWGLCVFILYSLFGRKGIQPAAVFLSIILTMIMIVTIYLIPIGNMFINEGRHSIGLVNKNEKTAGLPFYYNGKEGLRMELVYETENRILKMNVDDSNAIEKALPFVFISSAPIEKILSNKNVTIEYIGTFDNNWNKKGNRKYNKNLVKEVAIIRGK